MTFPQQELQLIQVRIKSYLKGKQDALLDVPINWKVGQLKRVLRITQEQYNNKGRPLSCIPLMYQGLSSIQIIVAGQYVEDQVELSSLMKEQQQELIVYLKITEQSYEELQEIEQKRSQLNKQIMLNSLYSQYRSSLIPFTEEKSSLRTTRDILAFTQAFPIFDPIIQNHVENQRLLKKANEQKDMKNQEQQQTNQQQREQNNNNQDGQFIFKIVIMALLIIYLFSDSIQILLLFVLAIYSIIKFKEHKLKKKQKKIEQQRQQQVNNNIPPTNNTAAPPQNQDSNNLQDSKNKEEKDSKIDSQVEEQKQEDTLNLIPKINQENNQNMSNENLLFSSSEAQIEDQDQKNDLNANQNSDIKENNNKEITINAQPQEQVNPNLPKDKELPVESKTKPKGLWLFILRIKECIVCFVMSMFPVWHVDLYNQGEQYQENQVETIQQVQQPLEQPNPQIQAPQVVQPQGFFDKIDGYLNKKIEEYENEKIKVGQELKELEKQIEDIKSEQLEKNDTNNQISEQEQVKNESDDENDEEEEEEKRREPEESKKDQ